MRIYEKFKPAKSGCIRFLYANTKSFQLRLTGKPLQTGQKAKIKLYFYNKKILKNYSIILPSTPHSHFFGLTCFFS